MGKNPDVTYQNERGHGKMYLLCSKNSKLKFKLGKAQRSKLLGSGKDGANVNSSDELKVKDGTIKTACQQVCPSDNISFGDISDPTVKMAKLKNNPRDFTLF